jgi:hypothetical protein
MAEDTQEQQFPDLKHQSRRGLWLPVMIVLSPLMIAVVTDLFSIPGIYAVMLVWSVIGCISYWIFCPQNVSFLRWFLVVESVIIELLITFPIVAKLIFKGIPGYIVVGGGYLVFAMSIYLVLHLLRLQKPMSLQFWTLLSLYWRRHSTYFISRGGG